jgi:hypothetical protein
MAKDMVKIDDKELINRIEYLQRTIRQFKEIGQLPPLNLISELNEKMRFFQK